MSGWGSDLWDRGEVGFTILMMMILVMFPIFIGDLIGRNDDGWNLDLSCHDIMRSFLQVVITRTLAEADELGTALPRYIREG